MQQHVFQTAYFACDTPDALPDTDRLLLELAHRSRENSYSPYSRFRVGAAVLFANGEMLGGANYENAAYPMCICAEQAVLSAAASRFPGVPVVAIAVTVQAPDRIIALPAAPCGACRQVICETEQKNGHTIRIIAQGETGPVFVFEKSGDLLPFAFTGDFLASGNP
ncbi:MAG: cytidine deaminase [Saprospiraceae bacterium]